MSANTTRRRFLGAALAGGAAAGLMDSKWLSALGPVSADEAKLDPQVVRFSPEIEPLVRLLEDTPRERVLEEFAARIHQGTTYREVLAAVLLAGVRNVQPRPEVGFKFHAVLVVNSAHLASLASPDEQRWLPIFWALDHFKDSQARDAQEGDWTMAPVDEAAVPSAGQARQALAEALDRWDESAADAAAAGLARSAKPQEIFELFCRYGARDFRSIGHKAIFVANSWRTLEHIGWQYGEPVLRSLAYALLKNEGTNPAQSDLPPDRPWRSNVERAARLRGDWQDGRVDEAATTDLLATLRQGSDEDACNKVVGLINGGISPQSVWDALFVGAGELLMRQPGIVGLHSVTSTNALRFAYETTQSDDTRRMLLLQNAAFLPLFREAMQRRGQVQEMALDRLEALPPSGEGRAAVDEIFADISRDRGTAARKVLSYVSGNPTPQDLIDAARLLVFFKGNDAHDYKFSSAVLEDHAHVSPAWRGRYLAASVYNLPGSADADNQLVERARAALAT